MDNMALLLSEGKPVAAAKAWFARATQMQTQAQMNMQCCLHFQRTQTHTRTAYSHAQSKSFFLAVMAWNRLNMSFIFTYGLHMRRTCKPGLSLGKHTMLLHVENNEW